MRKEYDLDTLRLKRKGPLPGLAVPGGKPSKVRVTIALDQDVVEHFKREAGAPGALPYQTRINQELRRVIEGGASSSRLPTARLKEALLADDDFLQQVSKRVAAGRR